MYEEIYNQIKIAAQKRNLKPSTVDAYCFIVRCFLDYTDKHWNDLSIKDADAFLTEKRLSGVMPETYNHYYSGLRFVFKKILKLHWDEDELPRMKRDRFLPVILSKNEINDILDATKNLKHKAMIAVMYSGGLRISEVIHLNYEDISRTNHSIHLRNTKSRRDRYTILADRTLDLLSEYWLQCGKPRELLFPSNYTGGCLNQASVNQFIKASVKKAGIVKKVIPHSFRHSFASHLLEAGCDIKYIQALLGHVDPRTTEIYLHISDKTLLGVKSPFDVQGD